MSELVHDDYVTSLISSETDYVGAIVDSILQHGAKDSSRGIYVDAILDLVRNYFDEGVGMAAVPSAVKATDEMMHGLLIGANAVLAAQSEGEI